MPFYPSGPAPVLHEDKQGVLPYAIVFCVEPGMLNLQETFLKQVLLLVPFSHPISCPQTPYASSSHEKDKHVSSHAAYEHPSTVYFQSEVPKRHGLCGEFAGLGKCIRSLVIFHHAFLSLEIRTVTRNGKLAERRTGCIFGFFSREVVRYPAPSVNRSNLRAFLVPFCLSAASAITCSRPSVLWSKLPAMAS